MATTDRDGMTLDDLLADARATRAEPSDALLARVLADAEAVARERARPSAAPAPTAGWLAALAAALGGWPALGGVAASLVLGLGLGVAEPAALSGLAGSLSGSLWSDPVSIPLGPDADPLASLAG